MIWNPLRARRRRRTAAQPFPADWERILARQFRHDELLSDEERARLRGLIHLFLAEKRIEGAGGFALNDEARLMVAANGALMVLGREFDLLKEVETVLIYPGDLRRPASLFGDLHTHGVVFHGEEVLAGEALYGGPILLSWDAVAGTPVHPDRGLNVIVHEIAHKIDMLTGDADGAPPLRDKEEARRWRELCGREFRHLNRRVDRGLHTFFDEYAAEHPAEFFATITEYFFEMPREMRRRRPSLYALFQAFYNQDPAARFSASSKI